jgi:hypothetical protein
MEMDLRVPEKAGNFLTTCATIVPEEELCSVELVIESVDLILLAHYKAQLQVLGNSNEHSVSEKGGEFIAAERLSAFQESY